MKPAPPDIRRKEHGTVLVHIEVEGRAVDGYAIRETSQTFEDIRREMVRVPGRRG